MIDFQFLFLNFPTIISDLSWQLIYILKKKKKTTTRVHQQMFDIRVSPSLLTFLQHKYTSKERYAD